EPNETPEQAARRELFEETGIQTHLPLQPFITLYIRKPETDYTFHLFKLLLPSKPSIRLSNEHLDYQWAHLHQLERVNFMLAARELIQKCQEVKIKSARNSCSNL
ncbi:MAG TPA: NUDIX domain-containing protein, partial [Chlamydiales bacterium]|nr:NUDIX domain-containing protein [Chlamydiales bacterium]